MPIKVLFLMRSFRIGGGEKCTVSLVNALDRSRFQVAVAVLEDVGPLKGELAGDVRVIPLGRDQGNALLFLPNLLILSKELRRVLWETAPDLVVGTTWFMNLVAGAVVGDIHILGARLLLINHTPVRDLVFRSSCLGVLAPVKRLITRRLFRNADRVVAITDSMGTDLREILKLRDADVAVIRNGIPCDSLRDAAKRAGLPLPAPYLVAVGRLEPEKGFDLLIEAFAMVAARLPHRLLIVGDGSLRTALDRQLEKAQLRGRVTLAGELSNPYPAMSGADFLVLSSHYEAFPGVLLEGLALELPIVATDCDGAVKILDGGEYGMLVQRGGASGLAAALLLMGTDPGLRDSFRRKSLARVREFSFERMVGEYQALLQELASEAGSHKGGAGVHA